MADVLGDIQLATCKPLPLKVAPLPTPTKVNK